MKSRRPARSMYLSETEKHDQERARHRDITVDDAIARLLGDLEPGVKPSSHRFYRSRSTPFKAYCREKGILLLREVKPDVLRAYQHARLASGTSHATVHHDEVFVCRLTAHCKKVGVMRTDFLETYKPHPIQAKERQPATQWELDRILKAIEASHTVKTSPGCRYRSRDELQFVKNRDRMILLTMMETACRSGEVLSLTMGDLRRDEKMISINKSGMADTRKNGIAIEVPVQDFWWSQLDAYLKDRPKLSREDLIFPLLTGGQMPSCQWANRFKTYCNAAGVPGISSHCIRHAVAGLHAEASGIFAAQRLLGQESSKSVERYTKAAGRGADWLKEKHAEASPLTNFAEATGRLKAKRRHVAYKK